MSRKEAAKPIWSWEAIVFDQGNGDRVGTPKSRSGKDIYVHGGRVRGQLQRVGRRRCGYTEPQESWPLRLSLVTPLRGAPLPLALRTFSRHFQHWCYVLVPALVNEITCPSGPQARCPPRPWAFHLESLRFSLEATSAWRSWCAGDLPQNEG